MFIFLNYILCYSFNIHKITLYLSLCEKKYETQYFLELHFLLDED